MPKHAACSHHIAYIAWPAGAWQPDLMSVVHGLQDCSRRLRMLLIRYKTATVHGQQERGSQAYGVRVHGRKWCQVSLLQPEKDSLWT